MSTIHLHQTTTSTPEQYVAGLIDFGPGRSKLFGNSADEYLKVHNRGCTEADVTEGSGGIWERLHYDWSDPNHVILKTTDSNVWRGSSGHTYTFKKKRDGTTDIEVDVVRDGKNLKGWMLAFVLSTIGKRVLEKAFDNSVKTIEIRNGAANRGETNKLIRPMTKGGVAIIVILLALLVGAVAFAFYGWRGAEIEIPTYAWAALAAGSFFSILVGGGLMALVFYSSRSGYDEPARRTDGGQ